MKNCLRRAMVALALFALGTGAIEAVEKNPSGLEETVLKNTSVSMKDSLNQGELKKLSHALGTTNSHNLKRILRSYIPPEKRENICREIGVPSMTLEDVYQRIRTISLGDLVGILSTQASPEELKNIFRDIQEGEDRYERITIQSKAMLDFLGTKDDDFLKKMTTIDSLDTKDECAKKQTIKMNMCYFPAHKSSPIEGVLEALKSESPNIVDMAAYIIKALIIEKNSDLMKCLLGSIPEGKSPNLKEMCPLNFLRFGSKVSKEMNDFCTDAKKVVATMDVSQDNEKNFNAYVDSIHNESMFLYSFLKRFLSKIVVTQNNPFFFDDLTLDEQKELSTRVGYGIPLNSEEPRYSTAIEYLAAYEYQKKHWNTFRNNIELLFSMLSDYKKISLDYP